MVSKVPEKLFKIGEIMEHTGLSRQTIHNYSMLGLISEAKRTRAGHRLYSAKVFEVLATIKELKKSKTLKEIREILNQEKK